MTGGIATSVSPDTTGVLLTCEHARNEVPADLRAAFVGAGEDLAGHRGWDPGALSLARRLASELEVPLVAGEVSRLVVDLNRSAQHPRLFSEWTRGLAAEARGALVARYWQTYRTRVLTLLDEALAGGTARVRHLSVHSFTPVFEGVPRDVDIGVLYDPSRVAERSWAAGLTRVLRREFPSLRVRRNRPYKGTSDGFCVALRRRYADSRYACIELEVSQGLAASSWSAIGDVVAEQIRSAA